MRNTDNAHLSASISGDPTAVISTGVSGLDDILIGGLRVGHLYLFDGDPGTGKTTLGLQFLLEGVRAGEPVLYITLSESERELRQVARSHGWSLEGINIFELLPMEETLKVEEQYTVLYPGEVELSETLKLILKRVEEVQPKRIVFDSLSELRLLARSNFASDVRCWHSSSTSQVATVPCFFWTIAPPVRMSVIYRASSTVSSGWRTSHANTVLNAAASRC